MIFIILSSLKTVHATVQCRYCIFHCSIFSLGLNQNPLLSYYERAIKYTVNVQYSVQYTLLLLYLMLVMSYLRNLSIKLYLFMYVTRMSRYITLYIALGIIRSFT